MIIDKFIKIKKPGKMKSYYHNLGYDISKNILIIEIKDLPKFSHHKIKVKCDICGKEKELIYAKYQKNTNFGIKKYACSQKCAVCKLMDTFMNNYGCISSQHDSVKKKQMDTNEKKYGGKSPQCNKDVKDKSYKTMIEKYGSKYSYQNQDIKEKFMKNIENTIKKTIETKIKKGLMVDYNNYNTYREYRKIVESLTRKYKKILFNDWDGLDYYDKENIKENLKLKSKDSNYPTIDHKISILYGFNNQIEPHEIGNIENLCITKRTNNSRKNSKNYLNIQNV